MKKALSILSIAVFALANAASAQTDAKAKNVLDAASKKANSLKSFKANFSLNLEGGKGGKVTDTRKGTISLKGQKYHLTLSGTEVISDTKTIWTYNKDTKEVQVSKFNAAEQTMSPAKLLTNFYDKEYTYSYKGEKKENGKNCDLVELIPIDKNKQKIAKVELLVDKASNMITAGTYWEKNGNKYHISITDFTPNANIADNYFTWVNAEHPGVEVVDLR